MSADDSLYWGPVEIKWGFRLEEPVEVIEHGVFHGFTGVVDGFREHTISVLFTCSTPDGLEGSGWWFEPSQLRKLRR